MEMQPKEEFFSQIEKTLTDLNYKIVKNDGQYIVAQSVHTWDSIKDKAVQVEQKREMGINYDAPFRCIHMGIKEDWNTRTVYSGIIYNVDDIKFIEQRTNSNVYYEGKKYEAKA